jgi:hypothetical protein
MARQNAYNIYAEDGSTPSKLMEVYNGVLDSVEKMALSTQLKNQTLSVDPNAGSVEVKRFVNTAVKNYGTARAAGNADSLNAEVITINLDTRKEVIEEFTQLDVEQYGVENLVSRRSQNYVNSMVRSLDTAFFTEAVSAGTSTVLSGATALAKFEELVQAIETTQNDYVDGVDRADIVVSLKPATYGELRNYIHTLPNPNQGGVAIETLNGVRVFSNHRQSVDAIAMYNGAVAQPVKIIGVKTSDIDMSVDVSSGIFFSYGTKAVMSDLIRYASFSSVSA